MPDQDTHIVRFCPRPYSRPGVIEFTRTPDGSWHTCILALPDGLSYFQVGEREIREMVLPLIAAWTRMQGAGQRSPYR